MTPEDTLERGEKVRPRPDPEEYKGEDEDELDRQLFQEMRSLEVKEGSLIFINVGRQTPYEICERIKGTVKTLLDKMGYENVAVVITMGEISLDAVRAEDREDWLQFLADSLRELKDLEEVHGLRI